MQRVGSGRHSGVPLNHKKHSEKKKVINIQKHRAKLFKTYTTTLYELNSPLTPRATHLACLIILRVIERRGQSRASQQRYDSHNYHHSLPAALPLYSTTQY
jgi:hypothetical protein